MQPGADVVFQATFFDGRWRGHADFLIRAERPSRPRRWSYDVADTKLARRVKASALLQVCVYADRSRGSRACRRSASSSSPATAVARPTGWPTSRRSIGREGPLRGPGLRTDGRAAATYPDPVDHCRVCAGSRPAWTGAGPTTTFDRRRDDPDRHPAARRRWRSRPAALGDPAPVGAVPDMNADDARRAARAGRDPGRGRGPGRAPYELIQPVRGQPGHGLAPCPSRRRDVFFDIEADPWIGDAGLEYLLGAGPSGRRTARLPRALGPRPGRREGRVRGVHRPGHRSARPRSRDARLPLRRLRADGAQSADAAATRTREDEVDRILRAGSSSTSTRWFARASAPRSSRTRSSRSRSSTCPPARARSPRPASASSSTRRWLGPRRRST